jgi:hypothetical protein
MTGSNPKTPAHRNAQGIAFHLRPALHSLHERLVSQENLPTQSLPNTLSNAFEHQDPIATPRFFPIRYELAQESIYRQPVRGGCRSDHRPLPAPGPLLRLIDHPRPNRVQNDLPTQLKPVGVLVYENPLETPLKQMPDSSMAPVRCLRVNTIQVMHSLRQVSFHRLNDQMVVIRHEAKRVADPLITLHHLHQYAQEKPHDPHHP